MEKKHQINLGYLALAAVLFVVIQSWLAGAQQVETIPWSRFETLLEDGRVTRATVTDNRVEGAVEPPLESGAGRFRTTRVDPEIAERLRAEGVETYEGEVTDGLWASVLGWVVPLVIFFAIWSFFIRRFADRQGFGGMMNVGKSKAKIYVETDTQVSFRDVAGVDEAKAELAEVVSFLKEPDRFRRLGARAPKGVLLVGPPGTGKTLLARAVAGEAGVPFFSISGAEFVEMFVGVGAARVRDLFEQARQKAPAIIFIDELDALGRARGAGPVMGGQDEKEQTLNQLLAEMDGFDPSSGIILLAATNRPEILDPALMRAGRFDRQVLVDRPDRIGRRQILQVHARRITLDPALDLDEVAALTPGFTGADLANLVNEAAIQAVREDHEAVQMQDFTRAIERIVAGLERRNRIMNPMERKTIAYHEIGHALVALSLPGQDPVQKVSIIPRGIGALGYTMQRPTEDRYLMRRAELRSKMAVLLGGRAAEAIVFAEVSTGASDDLRQATEIARAMVTRYGMTETLGQVALETESGRFLGQPFEGGGRRFSEATGREIDEAVRLLIEEAYETAHGILTRRRAELEDCAEKLLEVETLSAADLPERVEEPA